MHKIIFCFIFLVLGNTAFSQQGNFLYIDADNGQAFYVKIKEKLYSSTGSGYLIISGITDNVCELSVGFPKNAFPEQRFSVPFNKKDQGFQLKNFGEKGWGLFQVTTLNIVMNNNPRSEGGEQNQVKKTDAFSMLLSKVVNDPDVLVASPTIKTASTPAPKPPVVITEPVIEQQPVDPAIIAAVPVEKPVAPVQEQVIKDTLTEKIELPVTAPPVIAQEPIRIEKQEIVTVPSTVMKLFDQRFEKTYEATYVDKINGKSDTIRISYAINQEAVSAAPVTASPKPNVVNANCDQLAIDADVDKLRVKIMAEDNLDDKVTAARKYFRTKCFSVKQLKGLSELFPGDEGKYRFFDAAYNYTSDAENFSSLEDLMQDEHYKTRFKAMLRN